MKTLLFLLPLFCSYTAFSQEMGCSKSNSSITEQNTDTIRIEKSAGGFNYYQNTKILNITQLMEKSIDNVEAHKLFDLASSLHTASIGFSSIGGFFLGFSAGYAIGKTIVRQNVNMKVFLPLLGAGAAAISIGIGFEAGANHKAKAGVIIFNNAVKQRDKAILDLGFSPCSMMLKLNF